MKKTIVFLTLALLVLPVLALAQEQAIGIEALCGTFEGDAYYCQAGISVKNAQTGAPIPGVTLTDPATVCITGSDGTCRGTINNGTFNFTASKSHYTSNICLNVGCSWKKWTWNTAMQFTGIHPTVELESGVPNRSGNWISWDVGDSHATYVRLVRSNPNTCGGGPVDIGTFPVSQGRTWYVFPQNSFIVEAWFEDLYEQSPRYDW